VSVAEGVAYCYLSQDAFPMADNLDVAGRTQQACSRYPDPEQTDRRSSRCADPEQTDMLWNLAVNGSPLVKPLEALEMETDGAQKTGVYLLQSPKLGPTIGPGSEAQCFQSIFKPLDEEGFCRRGIESGAGALREEAAYIIDRIAGGQANVPVTARASLEEGGTRKRGSVQQFVEGSCGPVENFGMPHDLKAAQELIDLDEAQAVACFDIRVFNTDRHPGNLLLAGSRPHRVVCIDHGCVLPAWWALDMAQFDAWLDWPHVKEPATPGTLELVRRAVETLPRVEQELENLELATEAVWTVRICTTLLQKGILEHGLTLRSIALLMVRADTREPSWLEWQVLKACQAAAEPAEFVPGGKYGDPVFEVNARLKRALEAPWGPALERSEAFEEAFFAFLNETFSSPDVKRDAQAAEDATKLPWE